MESRSCSQTLASIWQTAFVVSHKMPWCALHTAVKNYNKSLENCKTFSSRPRPRPRPNVQDQDFHFCPRGASRPRPCQVSRTIHHWCNYMHTSLGCLLEANACMHYATPTTKNNTISPRVFGITHYVLCRIHEVISRSRKGAQPQAIHFRCYNFITWLTLCCP